MSWDICIIGFIHTYLIFILFFCFSRTDDLGGTETQLLDMVRRKSREVEEAQDKTLDLPQDDVSDE